MEIALLLLLLPGVPLPRSEMTRRPPMTSSLGRTKPPAENQVWLQPWSSRSAFPRLLYSARAWAAALAEAYSMHTSIGSVPSHCFTLSASIRSRQAVPSILSRYLSKHSSNTATSSSLHCDGSSSSTRPRHSQTTKFSNGATASSAGKTRFRSGPCNIHSSTIISAAYHPALSESAAQQGAPG